MRIQINDNDAFIRKRIQHAAPVRPGGFMPAAEYQRAHPRVLTGFHPVAERLLRGFKLVCFNGDRPHIHQPIVPVMAGHIRQGLAQHVGSVRRARSAVIALHPLIAGKTEQCNT
ncbi:hypothetical protein D3C78_1161410 [compost metagenome]